MKVFLGSRALGVNLDYVIPTHFDGWIFKSVFAFVTAGAVAETPAMTVRDTNGFTYSSKLSATQIAALAGASILWADFGVDSIAFGSGSQFLAFPGVRVNESDIIRIGVSATGLITDAYLIIEPATIDESLVL